MSAAAIIVAAGLGHRFGNTGKSFALLDGRPMAWWSLQAAAAAERIDELILVCGEHSLAAARQMAAAFPSVKPLTLVLGGERRQDSSLAGVHATSQSVDVVAIHDAARPLVTSSLWDAVVVAATTHGAAIAAIPVFDTIKRVSNGCVVETIARDALVSVQTPQAFHKQLLLDAFTEAERTGISVTDEATLIEQIGGTVVVVPGSTKNLKVTYPPDLGIAEALMKAERQ